MCSLRLWWPSGRAAWRIARENGDQSGARAGRAPFWRQHRTANAAALKMTPRKGEGWYQTPAAARAGPRGGVLRELESCDGRRPASAHSGARAVSTADAPFRPPTRRPAAALQGYLACMRRCAQMLEARRQKADFSFAVWRTRQPRAFCAMLEPRLLAAIVQHYMQRLHLLLHICSRIDHVQLLAAVVTQSGICGVRRPAEDVSGTLCSSRRETNQSPPE